jgi:hypothetical protein
MAKRQPPGPAWQVILEEIRSQNRATLEAVDGSRQAVEERLQRMDQDVRARMTLLQDAVKALDRDSRSRDATLGLEIRKLDLAIRDVKVGVQQNTVDIRDLARRVEVLTRLEERVAALEKPTG